MIIDAARKLRQSTWCKRLLPVLAFAVLATQFAGVVHGADLDTHEGGDLCHMCLSAERQSGAVPVDATQITLWTGAIGVSESSSSIFTSTLQRVRPPTRAPPR
jgi:hypothetical protein